MVMRLMPEMSFHSLYQLAIIQRKKKNKMGRAMMLSSPLKGLLCQFFLCVQCSMDDQTYHVCEKRKR